MYCRLLNPWSFPEKESCWKHLRLRFHLKKGFSIASNKNGLLDYFLSDYKFPHTTAGDKVLLKYETQVPTTLLSEEEEDDQDNLTVIFKSGEDISIKEAYENLIEHDRFSPQVYVYYTAAPNNAFTHSVLYSVPLKLGRYEIFSINKFKLAVRSAVRDLELLSGFGLSIHFNDSLDVKFETPSIRQGSSAQKRFEEIIFENSDRLGHIFPRLGRTSSSNSHSLNVLGGIVETWKSSVQDLFSMYPGYLMIKMFHVRSPFDGDHPMGFLRKRYRHFELDKFSTPIMIMIEPRNILLMKEMDALRFHICDMEEKSFVFDIPIVCSGTVVIES